MMNKIQVKELYEKMFANYPDALTVEDVTKLLGFKSQTAVIRRVHQHRIHCLKVMPLTLAPKSDPDFRTQSVRKERAACIQRTQNVKGLGLPNKHFATQKWHLYRQKPCCNNSSFQFASFNACYAFRVLQKFPDQDQQSRS